MSLSDHQYRILAKLRSGRRLRIVRSAITHLPVHGELISAGHDEKAEIIPMWRVLKLLDTGRVKADTGDLKTAHELVLLDSDSSPRE